MAGDAARKQVQTFCPLCVSRCGATATVTDGRFEALTTDPSHPTGRPVRQGQGGAGDRVPPAAAPLSPQADEREGSRRSGLGAHQLGRSARHGRARLVALGREHGPESVVFSFGSPSTTAISRFCRLADAAAACVRQPQLRRSTWSCAAGVATSRRSSPMGQPVPGAYMPDLEQAGCILYWGYNPSVARLAHATARPRRCDVAHVWSWSTRAVRVWRAGPTTGCACVREPTRRWRCRSTHVMIEHGWYDAGLRAPMDECAPPGPGRQRAPAARDAICRRTGTRRTTSRGTSSAPAGRLRPRRWAVYGVDEGQLALSGMREITTPAGPVTCRPVFDLVAEQCRADGAVGGRGDHRGARRRHRANAPHAVGVTPGRVLRLERPRAAQQRHPEHPGDHASSTP